MPLHKHKSTKRAKDIYKIYFTSLFNDVFRYIGRRCIYQYNEDDF